MDPSEIVGSLFPGAVSIQPEAFRTTSPNLAGSSAAFVDSITAVKSLLELPFSMAAATVGRTLEAVWVIEAITTSAKGRSATETVKTAEFRDALHRRRLDTQKDEGKVREIAFEIDRTIANQLADPQVAEGVEALRLSSLVMLWTTFECLAHDSWETVVNSDPLRFWSGLSAGGGFERDDEITSKAISLRMLAKHGFSLERSLGTVLAGKHDFSSIDGIAQAYRGLLGRGHRLVDELGRLKILCAVRNLVAHLRGIVDETFRGLTGAAQPLGSRISISGKEIAQFMSETLDVARILVTALDALMTRA